TGGDNWPPVPLPAEFNAPAVAAEGGKKLIDPLLWNFASAAERERLLTDAGLPKDAVVVINPFTHEVWNLGPAAGQMIASGKVNATFGGGEYDQGNRFPQSPGFTPMTKPNYQQLTDFTIKPDFGLLPPQINYVHDFGHIGEKEIFSIHGLQVLPPGIWNNLTPFQRGDTIVSINRYLEHLPQFQGPMNQPVFGVAVPWGSAYAAPQTKYEDLINGYALK